MSSLKIENAILCEDVRRELNGKHTIIGAVSQGFSVASLPGQIRIAAYLEVKFANSGRQEVFIRIGYGKEKAAAIIKAELEISDASAPIGLPVPSFNLMVQEPGHLTLEVSSDEKQWKRAFRRPIEVGEVPHPIVSAG